MESIIFEQAQNLASVPGVRHGFFTRSGGVSAGPFQSLNCSYKVGDDPRNVEENRKRVLKALFLEDRLLMVPDLAHSTKVIVLGDNTVAKDITNEAADALITSSSRHILGVTYADCLPVAIALEDGSLVAMIHAGWRGILGNIIQETIKEIYKINPNQKMYAAIGPGISLDGFNFAGDGLKEFKKYWPDFVFWKNTLSFVDLCGIAKAQLLRVGVTKIEKVGGFTDASTNYFSYRRDQACTGRHLAVVAAKTSR